MREGKIGGYFLVEEVSGSGKTSITNAAVWFLHSYGVTVEVVREPGGLPAAEVHP